MLDATDGKDVNAVVRANLRQQIAMKGLTARKLSLMANPGSPNKVSQFLSGKNDVYLSTFLVWEDLLGLRPGTLMREHEPLATGIDATLTEIAMRGAQLSVTGGPTIDDFLRWINETGPVISRHSPMLEYVDAYAKPVERGPKVQPVHIGSKSLLNEKLGGGRTPSDIYDMLTDANEDFCAASANDHNEVLTGRTIIDQRRIDQSFENGCRLNENFARVLSAKSLEEAPTVPLVLTFARTV